MALTPRQETLPCFTKWVLAMELRVTGTRLSRSHMQKEVHGGFLIASEQEREQEPSVTPGVTSPGNWAPRVMATTWKLLIEKALGNLLLTYLICLTKGKTYTKLGSLVSKTSLHSAWPGNNDFFPGKV